MAAQDSSYGPWLMNAPRANLLARSAVIGGSVSLGISGLMLLTLALRQQPFFTFGVWLIIPVIGLLACVPLFVAVVLRQQAANRQLRLSKKQDPSQYKILRAHLRRMYSLRVPPLIRVLLIGFAVVGMISFFICLYVTNSDGPVAVEVCAYMINRHGQILCVTPAQKAAEQGIVFSWLLIASAFMVLHGLSVIADRQTVNGG